MKLLTLFNVVLGAVGSRGVSAAIAPSSDSDVNGSGRREADPHRLLLPRLFDQPTSRTRPLGLSIPQR